MLADGLFACCFVQAVRDESVGGVESVRLLPHDGVGEIFGGAPLRFRPSGGELFRGDVAEVAFNQIALHGNLLFSGLGCLVIMILRPRT